jgi:hypothetical protein
MRIKNLFIEIRNLNLKAREERDLLEKDDDITFRDRIE